MTDRSVIMIERPAAVLQPHAAPVAHPRERGLHSQPPMSKPPLFTLVGAVLALTVLGCRERKYDSDETNPPYPMTQPGEQEPPLIEDEDAIGEDDDLTDDERSRDEDWDEDRDRDQKDVPPPEAEGSKVDAHHQPPLPSRHGSRG